MSTQRRLAITAALVGVLLAPVGLTGGVTLWWISSAACFLPLAAVVVVESRAPRLAVPKRPALPTYDALLREAMRELDELCPADLEP